MPKQRSLNYPSYLIRILPEWQTPNWTSAANWRNFVYNQPVASVCRDTIINDILASDFEIRPVDPKEEKKYKDDIESYTRIINVDMGNNLIGFDFWIEQGAQDLLTLPIGWNNEVVRHNSAPGVYESPDGIGYKFNGENPKGHPYKIVYIDGATIYPTLNKDYPIAQKIKENINKSVFFKPNEIARTVLTARPEMTNWGYGIAPPEKIYLALAALGQGDRYYASLLLDTPEAGILDLGDMSAKSANEWLSGFRSMFQGIDPWKIPVIYEHTKPINWVPFGRPPTDMLFDEITLKYSQLVHAGYGLMLSDTGLGKGGSPTLAGSIREERRSRRSGFAVTKEKIKNLINNSILPPYLKFIWIDKDEEAKVQKGRAFLVQMQALKAAKESGIISAEQGLNILKEEGFISSDIKFEKQEQEKKAPQSTQSPQPTPKQTAQQIADKVPAEEGGHGDITGKSFVYKSSSNASIQLQNLLREQFAKLTDDKAKVKIRKYAKVATRLVFDQHKIVAEKANYDSLEYLLWLTERKKLNLSEKSEFDAYPDIVKASQQTIEALKKLLDKDASWWQLTKSLPRIIGLILKIAYEDGAREAIKIVRDLLVAEDLINNPALISLDFELSNLETLNQLEQFGAALVTNVNDATKTYLARALVNGVEQGLTNAEIVNLIKDGANVEQILKNKGFMANVIDLVTNEITRFSDKRILTIVNTEIAKAETNGRVREWKEMGLTRKKWAHSGAWDVCSLCQRNISLGFVPIDFLYDSVFAEKDVIGPPGHPNCHGHIEFDDNEVLLKAGELNVWDGS